MPPVRPIPFVLALCGAACVLPLGATRAQLALPGAGGPPDGATLFRNQCGTCHSLNPADPPRQGPVLRGVVGRHVGAVANFKYSAGYKTADWVWDEAHLDTYLTNPQAMLPGSVMAYRQANADTRKRVIAYLKDQN